MYAFVLHVYYPLLEPKNESKCHMVIRQESIVMLMVTFGLYCLAMMQTAILSSS